MLIVDDDWTVLVAVRLDVALVVGVLLERCVGVSMDKVVVEVAVEEGVVEVEPFSP